MRHRAASTFLFAVLLLVGAGCFSKLEPAPAPAPAPQAEEPDLSAGIRLAGNAVLVVEQKPGLEVKAAVVANDSPGFLVIRATSVTGPKLGVSALLASGENENVVVRLSRATTDGETLYATVHADSNGNGAYDDSDPSLKDWEGNDLWSVVTVSAEASDNGSIPTL